MEKIKKMEEKLQKIGILRKIEENKKRRKIGEN